MRSGWTKTLPLNLPLSPRSPERRAERTGQMSADQRLILSRRTALAGLAAMCGASLAGHSITASRATENSADPVFFPSGPDAERYGAAQGFPVPDSALARQQSNPYQPK